eukprot:4637660-Pleurochrysis_carterae.AAC.1
MLLAGAALAIEVYRLMEGCPCPMLRMKVRDHDVETASEMCYVKLSPPPRRGSRCAERSWRQQNLLRETARAEAR